MHRLGLSNPHARWGTASLPTLARATIPAMVPKSTAPHPERAALFLLPPPAPSTPAYPSRNAQTAVGLPTNSEAENDESTEVIDCERNLGADVWVDSDDDDVDSAKAHIPLPHDEPPTVPIIPRILETLLADGVIGADTREGCMELFRQGKVSAAAHATFSAWLAAEDAGRRVKSDLRVMQPGIPGLQPSTFRPDNLAVIMGAEQAEVTAYLLDGFCNGFPLHRTSDWTTVVHPSSQPATAESTPSQKRGSPSQHRHKNGRVSAREDETPKGGHSRVAHVGIHGYQKFGENDWPLGRRLPTHSSRSSIHASFVRHT